MVLKTTYSEHSIIYTVSKTVSKNPHTNRPITLTANGVLIIVRQQ